MTCCQFQKVGDFDRLDCSIQALMVHVVPLSVEHSHVLKIANVSVEIQTLTFGPILRHNQLTVQNKYLGYPDCWCKLTEILPVKCLKGESSHIYVKPKMIKKPCNELIQF